MPIWEYASLSRETESLWKETTCPFCDINLSPLTGDPEEMVDVDIRFCPKCGWWKIVERSKSSYEGNEVMMIKGVIEIRSAIASLKELDLTDINTPIEEIRNYLIVRYDERFDVNPKVFENVVCSVFKDLGYQAITTAYSGDGGIDVILEKGKEQIGVQVKRTKNKIQVEQIRSLTGALILGDMTKGVFLTTSDFTKGGNKIIKDLDKKGYKIELMNAERFYQDLEFSQRRNFTNKEQIISLFPSNLKLETVDREIISDFF